MATFEENLTRIKHATYGEEVRTAIHDSIEMSGEAVLPNVTKVDGTDADYIVEFKTVATGS